MMDVKGILVAISSAFQPAADAIKKWEPTEEQKKQLEEGMKAILSAILGLILAAFQKPKK